MLNPRTAFLVGSSGIGRLRRDGMIVGTAFQDRNHNGIHEFGEEVVAGVAVSLGGRLTESAITDSAGRYEFSQLPFGEYRVELAFVPFWSVTRTWPIGGHAAEVLAPGTRLTLPDMGVEGPFMRVRNTIDVTDDTSAAYRETYANRQIIWGVRPGATTGVWGANPNCSKEDSLEDEHEVPPRAFPEFVGLYDARFQDPRLGLHDIGYTFGEGTWTDIRDFTSEAQVDTHFITMLAGYYYGGKYPMTLRWSPQGVARAYNGPVYMTGPGNLLVDMKVQSSLVIEDSTIATLHLISARPNLSPDWLLKWDLASLPNAQTDPHVAKIYPSAKSAAFGLGEDGYVVLDTLQPGQGYWLKHRIGADTLFHSADLRTRDTLGLRVGWNLVGALGLPMLAADVRVEPVDLVLGPFFGFDGGYHVADSLMPGHAYWVKSTASGNAILHVSTQGEGAKRSTNTGLSTTLTQACVFRFKDAAGNLGAIYVGDDSSRGAESFEVPPTPPTGVFDVRYSSERLVEFAREGIRRDLPLTMSSVRYPLTIIWDVTGRGIAAALRIGGEVYELREKGSLSVTDPGVAGSVPFVLSVTGTGKLPTTFALGQNYPNPFNPNTTIDYTIAKEGKVVLKVYNVLGEEVRTLVDEVETEGYRSVIFDGSNLASGVYFYRIQLGDVSMSRKMILLK
jgi:hypothetical protein